MLIVPVQALSNQTLQVQLTNQPTQINIYQQAYGLFMDVSVGPTPIITGAICQNLNRVIRSAYLGYQGDFAWWDTQGTDDPVYTGLGARWQLLYLTPAEAALARETNGLSTAST